MIVIFTSMVLIMRIAWGNRQVQVAYNCLIRMLDLFDEVDVNFTYGSTILTDPGT